MHSSISIAALVRVESLNPRALILKDAIELSMETQNELCSIRARDSCRQLEIVCPKMQRKVPLLYERYHAASAQLRQLAV